MHVVGQLSARPKMKTAAPPIPVTAKTKRLAGPRSASRRHSASVEHRIGPAAHAYPHPPTLRASRACRVSTPPFMLPLPQPIESYLLEKLPLGFANDFVCAKTTEMSLRQSANITRTRNAAQQSLPASWLATFWPNPEPPGLYSSLAGGAAR